MCNVGRDTCFVSYGKAHGIKGGLMFRSRIVFRPFEAKKNKLTPPPKVETLTLLREAVKKNTRYFMTSSQFHLLPTHPT